MLFSSASALPQVHLQTGKPPMWLAEAAGDAPKWARQHRDALRAAVAEHGSVLVRGLGLRDASEATAVYTCLAAGLMAENEAFAARRRHSQGVYSSSRWPSNEPMCMHHELSYARQFPGLILFACLRAPAEGGATTLADSPSVLAALPTTLVERFEEQGWLLIRNYGEEIGVSLAEAFGTQERGGIERYCHANAIDCEWRPGGGLRTWQRRRAIVRHPGSGQRCWFNQIAFLNEWTMDSEVREYLVDIYGADRLPFNTCFGNGDPIDPEIVALLNHVYETNTMREPWQDGDLLLVDNVRTAHAREAFAGPREVLVGMADGMSLSGHLHDLRRNE